MQFTKLTAMVSLAFAAALGSSGCAVETYDPTEESADLEATPVENTEGALEASPEEETGSSSEALSSNCDSYYCYYYYDNDHWYDGRHDRWDRRWDRRGHRWDRRYDRWDRRYDRWEDRWDRRYDRRRDRWDRWDRW
ncbi:hypothetical protein [Polyangium aurulentum]|uniref:hypothetical protein n=1 Tax=Polyangium aurulentum TaxID=2567896 RepID=UPI0010ADC2D4|nr:hypothetical protein [Polyangium aurulentum]UQA55791.1 hypothetical protein E8A73_031230 [Polyangium aurulentum]